MQRAYKAATKASIDELEALEGRIAEREANGEPPSETILWMRQRIIDNIEELGRNLKKFSREGTQITEDGQRQAVELANDATESLVETAAGKKPASVDVGIGWTALPNETLETFVGMAGNGSPLGELFATIPQVTTDAMQMALVQGISLGEGPRTVARRVRKAADIGRQRAETIARTEMIRSAREAQRQLYTQNPSVKGYRRQATQDSRVCLACLALSGTLQTTDEIMPSHPNCRCVMIPVTLSWAEITGDDSIPDTRPEVATPDRILAGLSDDDKLAIMGAKRYEMYLNGTSLDRMVEVVPNRDWGPNTRIKPLRDLGVQQPTVSPKPKPPITPSPGTPVVQPKPIAKPKPKESKPEVVKPVEQVQVVEQPKPEKRTAEYLRDRLRGVREKYLKLDDEFVGYKKEYQDIFDKIDEIQRPYLQGPDGGKWFGNVFTGQGGPWEEHPDYPDLKQRQNELKNLMDSMQQETWQDKMKSEMFDVMKSDNPIKIDFVSTSDALFDEQLIRAARPNQQVVKPTTQQFDSYKRGVEDALSLIDDRNLKAVFPRDTDIDANKIILAAGKGNESVGGWYAPTTNVIALNENAGSSYMIPQEIIAGHEFVHHLDLHDRALRKATIEFYQKRTAGNVVKQAAFGKTKVDKWTREYAGLVTDAPQLMGIEVPTVGMESILMDPLGFAESDFEYFKFMVDNVLCSSQQ
jgi:SPP1 gp7 family putative phage head morphogenesis protein